MYKGLSIYDGHRLPNVIPVTGKSLFTRYKEGIITQEYYQLVDGAYCPSAIDQATWEFTSTKNPKTTTFYCFRKTHKEGQLLIGRPIILGTSNLTQNASRLVNSR